MPCMKWSSLNHLQIGRYAEYYAKMEFASYGFEVYTSEVDDHGVDFIVKNKAGEFYQIQVKSLRNSNGGNYAFIHKSKMSVDDSSFIVCYMHFIDDEMPNVFLIPATAWKQPNNVLVSRDYVDKKSKPEWGIQFSQKNREYLSKYSLADFIHQLQ